MYLRTIFELQEEGIPPLRARIAERLDQSGPTVSQTVARMERDGLLRVTTERRLELTKAGALQATRVMRKHRLAECLLVDLLGLEWSDVHEEACRWEHVMSERVERRIIELLGHPTKSPYGNPIPGLDELADNLPENVVEPTQTALVKVPREGAEAVVTLRRFGEPLQRDVATMSLFVTAGLRPGVDLALRREGDEVHISGENITPLVIHVGVAQQLFVTNGNAKNPGN